MNNPWNPIEPPPQDINARRIDHTHPFDMFWARDHLGHYLFVFEFDAEQDQRNLLLPDLAEIKPYFLAAQNNSDNNRLILLLNNQNNWELFYSLCTDLVGATRYATSAKSAVQIFLRRLDRWHEFLKANRSGLLSEEKIKGLIGELLFIKKHLTPAFGVGKAVSFWQGPEGLPQDFNVGQSAIEVKCQSGGTRPYIRISSEDQLCSQLPETLLFVVTLGKAPADFPDAVHLPGLVADIRQELRLAASNQTERFNDLLYATGYIDSENYVDFSYVVVNESMFRVSEGFPKICPADIHPGISKVSYEISLAACAPYQHRPDWMEVIT